MDSFEEILQDYLLMLDVEKGLSQNTIDGYQVDLRQFGSWLKEEGEDFSAIDQLTLHRYNTHLGKSYKPASIARKITALKGFLDYLTENGLLTQTLTVEDHTKKPERLPNVLTLDQMDAMISVVPTRNLAGKRDKAILELLYATGMRVSELTALTLDRYYPDEQFVRVIGKGSKERLVPFGRCAKDAVDRYLQARAAAHVQPSDYVFLSSHQKKMSRQAVWKIVKKYARAAGIPFEVTPHTIRHTFATHLLENGVDLRAIQDMLGHADIGTTQIYVHLAFKDIEKQYHKLHPRSRGE